MDALFQIGKDLAELQMRVKAIESGDCGCKKGKRRRALAADLPKEQKALFSQVKASRAELIAGFNEVLKKLKLAVKLDGFTLVDPGVIRDDEDQCCMCCALDGQSGWQYCCDYSGCSSCC